ncbi:Gfo/Idh/MocA family oxidoreductase [Acidobacteria bacterium AB60]|nr:Gfo/Idh/MocA family oxidoreductase [Acidobacteria bacterium AB60]
MAGAGAFGRNHLRVYRELESAGAAVALVAALETDSGRAAEAEAAFGIPVFSSAEELLRADLHLQAASVAVPTLHHYAVASQLLEAGLDVLIEKPLTASLAEADALIGIAEASGRILQPGHLERFNPAVLAIEPRLHRPMFFEAHRLSVFTPRSLDVDVVLDLMIHDLDIVLTFAASPVREVRAVGLPILSPKVDIANVRVEFESGCVANFTASRVSTEKVRKLRFFQPRQYVSIDYARRDLLVIKLDSGVPGNLPPEIAAMIAAGKVDPAILAKMAEAGGSPNPGLSFAKPEIKQGEPLRLEIESFLDTVRTRQQPRVTARQGREALGLALAVQDVMVAHAHRAGLGNFFEPGA